MLNFDKAIRLSSDNERKAEIISRLNDYDNDDLLNLFRSANSSNYCFGFADVFDAEDINEIMCDSTPYDILCRVAFGNVTSVKNYLRFDGYENLESVTVFDLYNECEDNVEEMADWLMNNWNNVDNLYSEDYELFDAWDDIDNDRWDWEEYEEQMKQD